MDASPKSRQARRGDGVARRVGKRCIQREVGRIDVWGSAPRRPPRRDAERLHVRVVRQAAGAVGIHERRARGDVARSERMTELVHAHLARRGRSRQLGVPVEQDHRAVNHASGIGVRLAEATNAVPRRTAERTIAGHDDRAGLRHRHHRSGRRLLHANRPERRKHAGADRLQAEREVGNHAVDVGVGPLFVFRDIAIVRRIRPQQPGPLNDQRRRHHPFDQSSSGGRAAKHLVERDQIEAARDEIEVRVDAGNGHRRLAGDELRGRDTHRIAAGPRRFKGHEAVAVRRRRSHRGAGRRRAAHGLVRQHADDPHLCGRTTAGCRGWDRQHGRRGVAAASKGTRQQRRRRGQAQRHPRHSP